MRELPDWVLKHKRKGANIIVKNNRYYLYSVHSERRHDRKYPVLITDEYLGRITENGIIPPKEKIDEIIVKEYGLTNYYFSIFCDKFSDRDINDIISLSLIYAYDEISYDVFKYSYLSILYPNYLIKDDLNEIYKICNNEKTNLTISKRNQLRSINKIIISQKTYNHNL